MNKVWEWLGIAAVGLIVLIAGFVAFVWIWKLPIWSSIDSGWIQAIGSILALAVAIFVMSRQNKHASRLLIQTEERHHRRKLNTAAYILRRAHRQIIQGCAMIDAAGPDSVMAVNRVQALRDNAISSIEILNSIPILELGSADLAAAIQHMKDALRSAAGMMSRLEPIMAAAAGDPDMTAILDSLRSLTNTALETLDCHMQSLER